MNKRAQRRLNQIIFYLLNALAVLPPLAYSTAFFDPFTILKITILRWLSLAILVILALKLFNGDLILPKSRPALLIGLFLLLLAGATYFSVHPATSLFGLRKRYFGLTTYLLLAVVALGAAQLHWDQRLTSGFFRANSAVSILVGGLSLAQFLGWNFPKNNLEMFGSRAYATFGNPNFVAVYLVITTMLALHMFNFVKGGEKYFYAAAAGISFTGLLATQSIGAALGLLTALAVYYYAGRQAEFGNKTIAAVLITVLIIAAFISGGLIIQRFKPQSLASRLLVWQAAGRLILKYPLWGTGLDAIKFRVMQVMPIRANISLMLPEDAHNIFLTYGAAAGLPALFVLLLLWLTVLQISFRYGRVKQGNYRLHQTLAAVYSGYLIASLFNPEFIVSLMLIWLFWGISAADTGDVAAAGVGKPLRAAAAVLLVAVSIPLFWLTAKPAAAEYYLVKAAETRELTQILSYYRSAQQANPYDDLYSIIVTERLMDVVKADPDSRYTAIAAANGREAVRKAPDAADNYVMLGYLYFTLAERSGDKSDYRQAEKLFKQAWQKNPLQKYAVYFLVLINRRKNNSQETALWQSRYLQLTGRKVP